MTLVYVVAGEASGDVLGGRLIAALRARRPDLEFAGIGGPRMAEQGVPSLFPYGELALMGLLEVLPRIFRLKRLLADAAADVTARRPAVLITIDSPGFTLRLAEQVKPAGIPVLHYVAPQVWAWRPGRVMKLRQKVDRILCLLPFEPSRGMEVSRLLPVFGAALRMAAQRVPGLRPVVPVAPIVAEAVRRAAADWPVPPILVDGNAEKHDAFAAVAQSGGAGLIKSGTSSLEMAVAGIPHVVGYRVNPITAAIVRRLVKVPHASLVNLLAEREVVPERLQQDCTPEALAEALVRPLLDPAVAAAQRAGFREALARLRAPEGLPSEAAAEAVLRMLPG